MLAMFGQLESRLTGHSRRMDDGFKDVRNDLKTLGDKIDSHTLDDAAVERRVALIEQARTLEAKAIDKRGAYAGTLAGGFLMISWELLKHLLHLQ